MQRAHDAGMPVILNLAPASTLSRAVLQAATLIVVNEDEAEALGAQFACEANAAALHSVLGVSVIRTLGADGAEAASPDGPVRVAAPHVRVVDTTAAGDCFVGTLAASIGRRLSLRDAVARACMAAALACTVSGSQRSIPLAEDVSRMAG
jgi:ribokinase